MTFDGTFLKSWNNLETVCSSFASLFIEETAQICAIWKTKSQICDLERIANEPSKRFD